MKLGPWVRVWGLGFMALGLGASGFDLRLRLWGLGVEVELWGLRVPGWFRGLGVKGRGFRVLLGYCPPSVTVEY